MIWAILRSLLLPLLLWPAVSCSSDLDLTVFFDESRGLRTGDRVSWKGETIGEVNSIEVGQDGRLEVQLKIRDEFYPMVTDESRFLIQSDAREPERRSVDMVLLKEGGTPLPDGARVEGSTSLSILLEQGGEELRRWSRRMEEEVERWKEELRRLPEQKWYTELERRMDQWARELEQAKEEVRRQFKEEVLPALEETLQELKRRLAEQGREKDAGPLERRLEELKTI